MVGATHWFIWRGLVRVYQSLPHSTCPAIGVFGLVRTGFTKLYHAPDLSIAAGSSPLPAAPPATGDWVIDYDNGLGTVIDCGQHPT